MSGKDILVFVGIVAVWIGLVRWVLPALGIPTCCSGGACSLDWEQQPSSGKQAGEQSGTAADGIVDTDHVERVPPCPQCVSPNSAARTHSTGTPEEDTSGQ